MLLPTVCFACVSSHSHFQSGCVTTRMLSRVHISSMLQRASHATLGSRGLFDRTWSTLTGVAHCRAKRWKTTGSALWT